MSDPLRIEKLTPDHVVGGFECVRDEMDRFLTRLALTNQRSGSAQNHVAVSGDLIVDYYETPR